MGEQVPVIPRAEDTDNLVCDNDGEIDRSFSDSDYDVLKELFGCGLLDVWNIWWQDDTMAGEEICVYYTPRKDGYNFPPFSRTEVVVVESCSISVIE